MEMRKVELRKNINTFFSKNKETQNKLEWNEEFGQKKEKQTKRWSIFVLKEENLKEFK